MSVAFRFQFALFAAVTLLCCGCEDPGTAGSGTSAATGNGAESKKPVKKKGRKSEHVVVATYERLEQDVNAFRAGILENNAAVIWTALPAKFQTVLDSMIHQYAENMDPEIHTQSVRVLQKVTTILRDRKEDILANAAIPFLLQNAGVSLKKEDLEENWDAVVVVLSSLLESEFADIEQLKAVETQQFIEVTGSKLLQRLEEVSSEHPDDPIKQLKERLAVMTMTQVSHKNGAAVVRLEFPGFDDEPREMNFRYFGGKWLPVEVFDAFATYIQPGNLFVTLLLADQVEQNRERIVNALNSIEEVADELLALEDRKKFNSKLSISLGRALAFASQLRSGQGDDDESDDESDQSEDSDKDSADGEKSESEPTPSDEPQQADEAPTESTDADQQPVEAIKPDAA